MTARDDVLHTPPPPRHKAAPRRPGGIWHALTGFLGGVLGLAPHVLHHIGLLAGTVFVAGSGGTALFGAVGLLASVPLLLRTRRRFGTWKAPVLGLALFAALFALSAFVIGPAINGQFSFSSDSEPSVDHSNHHH